MMREILQKLTTRSQADVINDIITQREKHKSLTVHFLYFANIVRNKLFASTQNKTVMQERYRQALLQGDFLLPDGIALQIFYRCAAICKKIQTPRAWLSNCNGTDLTLPLLQALHKKYGKKLIVSLYGGRNEDVQKSAIFLAKHKIQTCYTQDGYTQFDRKKFVQAIAKQPKEHYHVLLVARGTPLQELRLFDHHHQNKEHNILALSVGGLFDFRSGREVRTPKVFRGWAEWLRRLCINPRKNAIKVGYSLALFWYLIRYLLLKR